MRLRSLVGWVVPTLAFVLAVGVPGAMAQSVPGLPKDAPAVGKPVVGTPANANVGTPVAGATATTGSGTGQTTASDAADEFQQLFAAASQYVADLQDLGIQ